ncbi:hypothetical protein DI005_00575 [Prauserella sp. PE36]|uniref:pyridoxamine 5'-phosphate oxidase family protein n=1 Tax=Prauserella sp. PE36 TaxID=1504709 RepID=UPI000DE57010|nr:pyridoxamine 5'-phosphate oxidase family protein [Prauserella sp. PE36]RBM24262.1 hypothetical protein DI005_00575 [Prauserella sp. PE36]
MSSTDEEIAYLRAHPMGHLATVGADGQPDVVPVAAEFDGTDFWGSSWNLAGEPVGEDWYEPRRTVHAPGP